jgi:hypothetical protein
MTMMMMLTLQVRMLQQFLQQLLAAHTLLMPPSQVLHPRLEHSGSGAGGAGMGADCSVEDADGTVLD